HRAYLEASGKLAVDQRERARKQLVAAAQAELLRRALRGAGEGGLDELIEAIADRRLDPHTPAERLLDTVGGRPSPCARPFYHGCSARAHDGGGSNTHENPTAAGDVRARRPAALHHPPRPDARLGAGAEAGGAARGLLRGLHAPPTDRAGRTAAGGRHR